MSQKGLEEHVANIHNYKNGQFQCFHCEATFNHWQEIEDHTLGKHSDKVKQKKPWSCTQCDKAFTGEKTLNLHIATAHEGHKPFKCDKCDASYKTTTQLKDHTNAKHLGLSLECKLCDKKLTSRQSFINHVNTVHKEKRKYKCELCDYSFTQSGNLKRHRESVHSNETFKCQQCDKTLRNKDSLKRHVAIVHDNIHFKCDICYKSFTLKSGLNMHLRNVHNIGKPQLQHKCPVVQRNDNKTLIIPEETHPGQA